MKESVSIFVLIVLFSTIAFLSGFKNESTSSGCSSAPDLTIVKPSQDENIENPPVSIEFTAIQSSVDLTAIDLNSVTAIIRDNMNKTIDITRYILSNCDILKKNCTFKGEVDLEAGEYILEVRVCNTTAACEMKEVKFTVFPAKPEDIINITKKIIDRLRCNYSFWANIFGTGCNADDDTDHDCIRDYCDNCPGSPNPNQADMDKDGIGDKCDEDMDGDGLLNDFEDRIGTKKDNPDSDNDGLIDSDELRFGTDPNKWDSNCDDQGNYCDGISDYDQIVSGEGCKPQGVVLQNSTISKKIPDVCIPPDEDKDSYIDAIDHEPHTYNEVSPIKYPLWIVKQEWDAKSALEFYAYPGKNLLNFDVRTKDIKYAVVKNECSQKIPNNLNFDNGYGGDIFTAIKARAEGSGYLNSWSGTCRHNKDEYTEQVTCCIDKDCNILKEVTRKIKVVCNIERRYEGNIFPWDRTVINYDIKGNNIKAFHSYLLEDLANYDALQGYIYKTTFFCSCDNCEGCLDNPCSGYPLSDETKAELMHGSGTAYLVDEREDIRVPNTECKYSYSIPSYNFENEDGFRIERYISSTLCVPCCVNMYPELKNFVEHYLYEEWKPVKITLPEKGGNNKYVYLASSPGRLIIGDLKSSIESDNEVSDYWKRYLRWGIDPVDDSHSPSYPYKYVTIYWNTRWDNDGRYGEGATTSLWFSGMPRHNSDFGPKKVRFEMIDPATYPLKNDPIVLDEIEIKIFFPKEFNNHPYLDGDQENTPNWYYYWGQEVPPLTSRSYSSDPYIQCGENKKCYGWWRVKSDYTTDITIYDDAKLDFYFCTGIMVHENEHETVWRSVWPNGYDANKDQDGDDLDDEWEIANQDAIEGHPHRSDDDKKRARSMFLDYSESLATDAEQKYYNSAVQQNLAEKKDWACPGTNCK